MSFLKRLFNEKVVDLDNDGKIESLKEEIQGVFSQFHTMANKLDDVNSQLDSVIEDEVFAQECERDNLQRIVEASQRRLEESSQRVEKALLEKEANAKLKDKVSEFLPN